MRLNEIANNTQENTVETETGTATLRSDGSMVVDNSGYIQHLTPEQVQAAWSGASRLPLHPRHAAEMKDDGLTDEEMIELAPFKDDMGLWDFGDEQHEIPPKEEFTNNS